MGNSRRDTAGDLIIAADFGTSGVKVGLVDADFRIVARTLVAYPLLMATDGWAEQNPEDWWNALGGALRQLSSEVEHLAERAKALVFCAQMCGLVCAGADGKPLRPGMIWMDKRSAGVTRELVGGFPSIQGYQALKLMRWIKIANGAPAMNGMDPTGKMLWVKRFEPDIYQRTAKFLDVKDWLVHRGTGRFCTTADSANLTWLMDSRPNREGWSQALADRVGIPLAKMPDIVEGTSVVGGLLPRAAAELGLQAGLPVIAGGGDVTATALGSGAVGDGELHICASTSAWVSGFFPKRKLSVFSSYATITSSLNHRPLLIATQETAGSAFGWVAKMLGQQAQPDNGSLAELYADPGDPAADDPFFMPWLAGERVPVDDHRLRGAFFGLSLHHDRNAVLRAVVEGVALNTRWMYAKVARETGVSSEGVIPLLGGVALNPFFAQAVADSLNRPVTVSDPQHRGVLGAAAMAASALGWRQSAWDGAAAIRSRDARDYQPAPIRVEQLDERYRRLVRIRTSMIKLYRADRPRLKPSP